MWSGNEEVNDEGQPVRLYLPIQYSGSRVCANDPTASFIGGPASTTRQCPVCGNALLTVLQLHIPSSEKSFRVEACNSASCFRSLFESSKFHFGGNGVVTCKRILNVEKIASAPDATIKTMKQQSKPEAVDDWGVSSDDTGLDDLEAKLASMETTNASKGSTAAPKKATPRSSPPSSSDMTPSVLPIMALHSIQEPPARTASDDPRDVGLHGTSNQKIEDMLARYLEDEEDQDIVEMLKGSVPSGTGGQELDQDLTEEEMTFLRFSDRIKRSPRQVLRHAPGGEPLWSIPLPSKPKKNKNKSTNNEDRSTIPWCSCGAPRRFECQLLPSVLHVLNVDKYAKQSRTEAAQLNDWYNAGGMDFGAIAIYTCSNSEVCTSLSLEEFVIVQDTAEEQPKIPAAALRNAGDVIVDENSNFDQDDENDEMQDD